MANTLFDLFRKVSPTQSPAPTKPNFKFDYLAEPFKLHLTRANTPPVVPRPPEPPPKPAATAPPTPTYCATPTPKCPPAESAQDPPVAGQTDDDAKSQVDAQSGESDQHDAVDASTTTNAEEQTPDEVNAEHAEEDQDTVELGDEALAAAAVQQQAAAQTAVDDTGSTKEEATPSVHPTTAESDGNATDNDNSAQTTAETSSDGNSTGVLSSAEQSATLPVQTEEIGPAVSSETVNGQGGPTTNPADDIAQQQSEPVDIAAGSAEDQQSESKPPADVATSSQALQTKVAEESRSTESTTEATEEVDAESDDKARRGRADRHADDGSARQPRDPSEGVRHATHERAIAARTNPAPADAAAIATPTNDTTNAPVGNLGIEPRAADVTAVAKSLVAPGGERASGTTSNDANAARQTTPARNAPVVRLGIAASQAAAGGEGPSTVDRARFVQRVYRALHVAHERGGEVRLRLSPPELGQLRLELTLHRGALTARIEAETPSARALLLDNISILRDRLAEQNIRVERFDVELMDRSPQHSNEGHAQDFSEQRRRDSFAAQKSVAETEPPTTEPKPAAGRRHDSGQLNVII